MVALTCRVLGSRYRLEALLGRGAMGEVYRAHDTLLDRDVAVKLLAAGLLDAEARARLLREAQAAARLSHPNILAVYDAGECDGVPFVVMELGGPSLREQPPPTLDAAVALARQVCAALDHAHARGIVHRDVKPENILVAPDGAAKLADFGLARVPASRLTAEGAIVGTPFYLAPEQILGQAVDARTDLYALGVTLYELAAGRLPFPGEDVVEVLGQHLHATPVPPSAHNPAIPPALDALIVQMLSKRPDERPPSAAAVLRALDGLAAPADRPAAARAPSRLPSPATPFVGRRQALAELSQLLLQPEVRLVTLTGPGGTGKTRLALHLAHELAEQFEDGALFVSLAAIADPALVLPALAQALGLREDAARPVAEQLAAHLRDKRLLLVLDNLEQVTAAAPAVAALLPAAPRLTVLATSRALLRVYGEHAYPVPPMAWPDLRALPPLERLAECEAVQLFVQRAQAARPGFRLDAANARSVVDICAGVDGLPLAIELAAARVRFLPLSGILDGLCSRLSLLAGGPRDLPARQQSLRAAIDWSYGLLDPGEQALFRRLSVFSGGFDLEAAAAVAGPGAAAGVESLADQSLLQVSEAQGRPRFAMLETICEYARERLEAELPGEVEEARRSHAGYFRDLAREAGEHLRATATEPTVAWLDRLDAERDNLRAALEWCLPAGGAAPRDVEAGAQAAADLSYFWLFRGRLREGRQWLERALAAVPARGRPGAKLATRAGIFAWTQGDYAVAEPLLEQAVRLWREIGDRPSLAEAVHILGHLRLDQRRHAEARELLQESLDLYRELGDTALSLTLADDLALLAYHQGEFAAARARFEQSLRIYRQRGNTESVAATLNRLGELARLDGDWERADALLAESLALCREIAIEQEAASVLKNQGHVALARGDRPRAHALFAESLGVQREQGNKQGMAECLAGLGGMAQPAGQAVRLLAAADALLAAAGVPLSPADRAGWERSLALARAGLEAPAYERSWEEGRALAGSGAASDWELACAEALAADW